DDLIAAIAGLARSQTGRLLLPESRDFLHGADAPADGVVPSVVAMQALQASHDINDHTWLTEASKYHCPNQPAECGWPVRYAAVQLLDKRVAFEAAALDLARHDPAYEVRLAAMNKIA